MIMATLVTLKAEKTGDFRFFESETLLTDVCRFSCEVPVQVGNVNQTISLDYSYGYISGCYKPEINKIGQLRQFANVGIEIDFSDILKEYAAEVEKRKPVVDQLVKVYRIKKYDSSWENTAFKNFNPTKFENVELIITDRESFITDDNGVGVWSKPISLELRLSILYRGSKVKIEKNGNSFTMYFDGRTRNYSSMDNLTAKFVSLVDEKIESKIAAEKAKQVEQQKREEGKAFLESVFGVEISVETGWYSYGPGKGGYETKKYVASINNQKITVSYDSYRNTFTVGGFTLLSEEKAKQLVALFS